MIFGFWIAGGGGGGYGYGGGVGECAIVFGDWWMRKRRGLSILHGCASKKTECYGTICCEGCSGVQRYNARKKFWVDGDQKRVERWRAVRQIVVLCVTQQGFAKSQVAYEKVFCKKGFRQLDWLACVVSMGNGRRGAAAFCGGCAKRFKIIAERARADRLCLPRSDLSRQ